MKKFMATASAFTMITALCIPTMAADIQKVKEDIDLVQARRIAYMDITSADAETKDAILKARETVIYSESWVAAGVRGRVIGVDGKVKEVLPEFHDLFPADWEIPVHEQTENEIETAAEPNDINITNSRWLRYFTKQVSLSLPPATNNTAPFFTLYSAADVGTRNEQVIETLATWGTYEESSNLNASYNIGYENRDTGVDLEHKTHLKSGEMVTVDPPYNVRVSIRASACDSNSTGIWAMYVNGLTNPGYLVSGKCVAIVPCFLCKRS